MDASGPGFSTHQLLALWGFPRVRWVVRFFGTGISTEQLVAMGALWGCLEVLVDPLVSSGSRRIKGAIYLSAQD